MNFPTIHNDKLSDKVVQVIMEQITSGVLKPGQKLPNELELSEALGVSRGILREALIILQARNFICRKPKEGTIVNPDIENVLNQQPGISLKEATYLDLLEMRECIEQRAVEKIIDTASDEQLKELEELLSEQPKREKLDYYFHFRLAELSQNAMFVNFIETYYDVIDELAKTTEKKNNRRAEIHKEHMAIMAALKARDKEAAKKAVLHHLKRVRENIRGIQ